MSQTTTATNPKWKQTNVMLPTELRKLLIAEAVKNGRSMSGQIVVMLADALGRPDIRPVGRMVLADSDTDAEPES